MKVVKMRKTILINGNKIKNKTDLYNNLEKQLNLSYPMGHNLDALWDVLSHNHSLKKITIIHLNQLSCNLGDYTQSLIKTLIAIQDKNNLKLDIYEGKRNETK